MLSFWSAIFALVLTNIGFTGLTVISYYALVDLGNDVFPNQLWRTIIGSTCFFLYGLATGEKYREQLKFAFTEDLYLFLICSFCICCVEIGIILSISWTGPSIFAIGLSCTGPIAYLMSYIMGLETVIPLKVLGTIVSVGAAIFAVLSEQSNLGDDIILGVISLSITVVCLAGYSVTQKFMYPKYTVVFVTTTTLVVANFPLLVCCGLTSTWNMHWGDANYETLWCVLYSGIIGQFMLYLISNSAVEVLSSSMVGLFGGIQPVLSPWVDVLRTCYFDQVAEEDRSCAMPPWEILLAAGGVLLGLLLYSWGESTITDRNMNRLSEAASYHSKRYEDFRRTGTASPLVRSINSSFFNSRGYDEEEYVKTSNRTGNIYSSLHSSSFSYLKEGYDRSAGKTFQTQDEKEASLL